jgi:hypothetical protein
LEGEAFGRPSKEPCVAQDEGVVHSSDVAIEDEDLDIGIDIDLEIELADYEPLPKALVGAYLIG